jgi:hypothetical protein
LAAVLAAAPEGSRVVHCCAPDVPVELLVAAGADAVALDASLLSADRFDAIGETIEGGTSLWLGVLPSTDAPIGRSIGLDTARDPIRRLWSELGFPRAELAERLVATPACGLAGASPEYARRVLKVLRDVGRWLSDTDD